MKEKCQHDACEMMSTNTDSLSCIKHIYPILEGHFDDFLNTLSFSTIIVR
jgi:hypothetical protein